MSDRSPSRSANRPRRRLALLVAAGAFAAGGATTLTAAVVSEPPAPPRSAAFDSTPAEPAASARSSVPDGPGPKAEKSDHSRHSSDDQAESAPTKITIARVGVNADFVTLDLTGNGELGTPKDPDQVGWFTGAHTPGGPGVAVVAGHVTWNGAEAAFFELGDLQQNDRIKIEREDGSTAIFAVQRRDTFAKDSFPTDQVYSDSKEPRLVLITCGGEFDSDRHYYDSNVIVWAELVSIRS